VGDNVVARFGEVGRVVAPAPHGAASGSTWRIAVRPERVKIGAQPVESDGGSHLSGTLREIVYLGMLTQYHVDTPAGRVVSHRMNDEGGLSFESGAAVHLAWAAEHTSVLGPA
jgi:ABC-type Fe3+/spermidine/putrescine transport system ATPase subunit